MTNSWTMTVLFSAAMVCITSIILMAMYLNRVYRFYDESPWDGHDQAWEFDTETEEPENVTPIRQRANGDDDTVVLNDLESIIRFPRK